MAEVEVQKVKAKKVRIEIKSFATEQEAREYVAELKKNPDQKSTINVYSGDVKGEKRYFPALQLTGALAYLAAQNGVAATNLDAKRSSPRVQLTPEEIVLQADPATQAKLLAMLQKMQAPAAAAPAKPFKK